MSDPTAPPSDGFTYSNPSLQPVIVYVPSGTKQTNAPVQQPLCTKARLAISGVIISAILIAVILGAVLGVTLSRKNASSGIDVAFGSNSTTPSATPSQSPSTSRLPPYNIVVQSANTKQDWMALVSASFNAANVPLSNGRIASITVVNTGSSLTSSLRPAIWSPQSMNWVTLQESAGGSTLVANKAISCPR